MGCADDLRAARCIGRVGMAVGRRDMRRGKTDLPGRWLPVGGRRPGDVRSLPVCVLRLCYVLSVICRGRVDPIWLTRVLARRIFTKFDWRRLLKAGDSHRILQINLLSRDDTCLGRRRPVFRGLAARLSMLRVEWLCRGPLFAEEWCLLDLPRLHDDVLK